MRSKMKRIEREIKPSLSPEVLSCLPIVPMAKVFPDPVCPYASTFAAGRSFSKRHALASCFPDPDSLHSSKGPALESLRWAMLPLRAVELSNEGSLERWGFNIWQGPYSGVEALDEVA